MAQKDDWPNLRKGLQAWADSQGDTLVEHPDEDSLIALALREATEQEAETIREHLVLCPICTQRLLDLQQFLKAGTEDPSETLSQAEAQAQVDSLNARIDRFELSRSVKIWRVASIAAALAFVSLLALFLLHGRSTVTANIRMVTLLDTTEVTLDNTKRIARKDVPGSISFQLRARKETHSVRSTDLYLEVLREQLTIERISNVRLDPLGVFTLHVPKLWKENGLYEIRISQRTYDAKQDQLIATYRFVLY